MSIDDKADDIMMVCFGFQNFEFAFNRETQTLLRNVASQK